MDAWGRISAKLAAKFDALPGREGHEAFQDECYLLGQVVGIRYYLGRLVGRNLFRETDQEVTRALVEYLAPETSERGAALVGGGGSQGWLAVEDLLRHTLEMEWFGRSEVESEKAEWVREFLSEPEVSLAGVARKVGRSEGELGEMMELKILRKLAKEAAGVELGEAERGVWVRYWNPGEDE